jgi:hypothetical protein
MKRRTSKYVRCKKCMELVSDAENCANCANMNPLAITRKSALCGKRGSPTLDIQEGNWSEWNGGNS